MGRKLTAAVVAAIALNVLITGYGAIAAGEQAQATCSQDHGVVRDHECMKGGQVLFNVPL